MIEQGDNLPWCPSPRSAPSKSPLRLPLQDVFKIGGIGTVPVGRVETGALKPGNVVTFASTGLTTEVKSTEMHHEALPEATPGMSIGFNVKNVAVKDIRRGFVCSNSKADPAREVDTSRRSICSTTPARSSAATRPSSTATHRVRIRRDRVQYRPPLRQRDREGAQVHQERRRRHRPHGPAEAMCVEIFTEYPPLGRFAVRDMHQTDVKGTI